MEYSEMRENMERRRRERREKFDPPSSYYRAKKDFSIKFGGWGVSFNQGEIIKVNDEGVLQRWRPLTSTLQEIIPPISNAKPLQMSSYGDERSKKKALQRFTRNTEAVSNANFESEIMNKREEVVSTSYAIKSLKSIPSDVKVKISFV